MATKKIPFRENREFENFAKTQGIWFAQVVNSLMTKVKDIVIFAAKNSIFFPEAGQVCQVKFVYEIVTNYGNWHREILRLDRENTGNLKIQFEWVPWYGVLMSVILKVKKALGRNEDKLTSLNTSQSC